MKVSKLFALLLMTTVAFGTKAAEPAKFQFEVDYSLGLGLKTAGGGHDWDNSHSNTVNLNLLYNINRKFTAGVGLGYESSTYSDNIHLFGNFRYRPFKASVIKDFYAFTNIGMQVIDYNQNTHKFKYGLISDIGIGWLKMFRKHFGIDIKLSYNYRRDFTGTWTYIETDENISYSNTTIRIHNHYMSLGLGLVF